MRIWPGELKGIFIIELEPQKDQRGFVMRTYDEQIFKDYGINQNWVQENHSCSKKRGTIRGLHFQFPPYAEAKLIRTVSGEVFDVFVDLRKGSDTFGKWGSVRLSSENKKMVYIPRGFAHGVCTLTDNSEMIYKVDNYYVPDEESTIKWDDPDIGIEWPVNKPVLSEKDSKARGFKEFAKNYGGLKV
jgi:dTDP-4-dehydrorhamnose 3,5-epimerase